MMLFTALLKVQGCEVGKDICSDPKDHKDTSVHRSPKPLLMSRTPQCIAPQRRSSCPGHLSASLPKATPHVQDTSVHRSPKPLLMSRTPQCIAPQRRSSCPGHLSASLPKAARLYV
ncbi:hypothetical protein NHX12_000013 [Muraenolepis orangiensis]|uniref:Uncharacterized protein n=1 Tax=Muraenolepis orangiensis TaxID=630683 RepID=A0A9Q0I477_9TELE|nr:hypothetical protein NHX12_000013 [Muraenolepis orangiensis]